MKKSKSIDRNPPTSNRQLLILAGMFLAFIGLIIWGISWFFGVLVYAIPPQLEQKLGAAVIPIYERQAEKSTVQDSLNSLLDRLEENLRSEEKKDRNYRVLYIPKSTVNAMALPGDAIVVYQGLIEKIDSENELMMVLGHELGHFVHRDHLRGIGRSLLLQATLSYLFGDAGSLAGIAASVAETIGSSSYSQSQESEADEFGLNLLNKTYGHVAGATDFFKKMSREQTIDLAFLSSHPNPAQRVRQIEKSIAENKYLQKSLTPIPAAIQNASN
jgi:predicted Zn-dependent protease